VAGIKTPHEILLFASCFRGIDHAQLKDGLFLFFSESNALKRAVIREDEILDKAHSFFAFPAGYSLCFFTFVKRPREIIRTILL